METAPAQDGRAGRGRVDVQQPEATGAQAGIGALGDDEYAQLIKDGLDRLAQQLNPE